MYTYYSSPWQQLKAFLRRRETLPRLILINTGIWVIISLLRVITLLAGSSSPDVLTFVLEWLGAPANPMLIPERFWTLITYNFVHFDFIHLLFNLLWLYWMGLLFTEYLSGRRLLWVYLMGGVSGYLVYLLAFNIFPGLTAMAENARLIGASASVMAVVSAIAFYLPNYSLHLLFFGRIRLIWLALGLFALDFLMISSSNPGGHLAHMGGFLFGYIYITLFRHNLLPKFDPASWFRPKPKVTYRSSTIKTDEQYNTEKKQRQEEIDRILDKIKESGYQSLTEREKEILFRASKNDY
ncbi:MAG: hypothetical protein PWR20_1737 [Bacteroidales bacterium]|nr:hypothetical protein [Bacteroidales bacterium]MDN5329837.1 hypothetical protein [Bacteroidales bacterium]